MANNKFYNNKEEVKKTKYNNEEEKKDTLKDNEYITELENRLKQMEDMFKTLSANVSKDQQPIQNITQYIGDNNKDVVVTSLTVGELNLATEGYGRGAIYTFNHIGEELSIPYEDLKKIIKNNKSFIEGGNVFINDEEVIKSQRLTNVYKKLLSYDKILELFNKDKSTFKDIFMNMTNNQKETLKRIIFEKLYNNEDVDMNIVQIINDDMHIDIMGDFKKDKDLQKYILEEK